MLRIDKRLYKALKATRVPGTFTRVNLEPLWKFLRSISVQKYAEEVAYDMGKICALHFYMCAEDAPKDTRDESSTVELTANEQEDFKSDIYSCYHRQSGSQPTLGSISLGDEWRVRPPLYLVPATEDGGYKLVGMAQREIVEKPEPNYFDWNVEARQKFAQPVAQSVHLAEPVIEVFREPVIEAVREPVIEAVREPVIEAVRETVVEPVIVAPVAEPVVDKIETVPLVVEPLVELVTVQTEDEKGKKEKKQRKKERREKKEKKEKKEKRKEEKKRSRHSEKEKEKNEKKGKKEKKHKKRKSDQE
jgi:hypothetical protein